MPSFRIYFQLVCVGLTAYFLLNLEQMKMCFGSQVCSIFLQSSGSPNDKLASISLPHDYSPVSLLNAVETLYTFTGPQTAQAEMDTPSQAALCKQAVAARRHQEMQVRCLNL